MSKDKSTFGRRAHFLEKNQILPNSLAYSSLSDAGMRLIVALNALPANWIIQREDIMERLNYGKDKMLAAVKDCVEKGYMIVTQRKLENGHFAPNHYEFDTTPSFLEDCEKKCPDNECEPRPGFPDPVNSGPENPHTSCSLEISSLKKERKDTDPFLPFLNPEEDEQKLKRTEKYSLDDSAIRTILKFPLDRILLNLEAYDEWIEKRGRPIDECAAIIKFVTRDWRPVITPEKLEQAKEEEVKIFQNQISMRKEKILELEKQWAEKLPFSYRFAAKDNIVEIKSPKGFTPIGYHEDDVIEIVKEHIEKYRLKE